MSFESAVITHILYLKACHASMVTLLQTRTAFLSARLVVQQIGTDRATATATCSVGEYSNKSETTATFFGRIAPGVDTKQSVAVTKRSILTAKQY
jgi:hypothetical protein